MAVIETVLSKRTQTVFVPAEYEYVTRQVCQYVPPIPDPDDPPDDPDDPGSGPPQRCYELVPGIVLDSVTGEYSLGLVYVPCFDESGDP